jgi:NAD(P)-dependent dehydrogenase (short-subunit alcohol dehydrogenase family)
MAVEADCVALFETAEKHLGPIYGLVNNAAVIGSVALHSRSASSERCHVDTCAAETSSYLLSSVI